MDAAYPGLGIGAVVPSDRCGFGCTLMSKRALSLAQFDGYDGSGTEDLYMVWKRWHRNTTFEEGLKTQRALNAVQRNAKLDSSVKAKLKLKGRGGSNYDVLL
jgi:hypothetical protein